MYNDLFGLRKDPFRVTPDPSFLFLTDQHREALSGLTFAILAKGFALEIPQRLGVRSQKSGVRMRKPKRDGESVG